MEASIAAEDRMIKKMYKILNMIKLLMILIFVFYTILIFVVLMMANLEKYSNDYEKIKKYPRWDSNPQPLD